MSDEVIILYRPVGPKELQLIEASGYREFPPRLPEQPIFYPVLNEEYASAIARDWNAGSPSIGAGYVTRFAVRNSYLSKFRVQKVGTSSGILDSYGRVARIQRQHRWQDSGNSTVSWKIKNAADFGRGV
jgi:hypothetical protein